jgi:hypothetical protein
MPPNGFNDLRLIPGFTTSAMALKYSLSDFKELKLAGLLNKEFILKDIDA